MNPEITEQQHTEAPPPGEPTGHYFKLLLLAVIAQAVEDARRHLAGRPCDAEQGERTAGPDALRWLQGPRFEHLCTLVDLDPDAVRQAVHGRNTAQ